jgi:hypothetical protein
MKNIIIGFLLALGAFGCTSNKASLTHFPSSSQLDFERMDSIQSKDEKQFRFFYNCNFENDYLIKATELSPQKIGSIVTNALKRSGFVVSNSNDSSVISERGLTPWEWKTIAVVYFKNLGSHSYLYIRTEISQDITCGPNLNRAKPILKSLCGHGLKCMEVKEILDKSKNLLWPVRGIGGGLAGEAN